VIFLQQLLWNDNCRADEDGSTAFCQHILLRPLAKEMLPEAVRGLCLREQELLTVIAVSARYTSSPVAKTTSQVPAQADVEGKIPQAAACNHNGPSSDAW
jgi:hypothetical protein